MSINDIVDRRFGMIAINKGFATRQEIDRALQEQKRLTVEGQAHKIIGDILVAGGVLTSEQRDEILTSQKSLKKTTAHKDEAQAPADKDEAQASAESTAELQKEDVGFDLTVSEDKIEAYICPKKAGPCEVTIDDLKQLLENEGITYGIVDDDKISEYLAADFIPKRPWMIAEGQKLSAGKNAEIKYYFDTEPLKVGTLTEAGKIDYKDRGEISQVTKGELIAEKVPGTAGSPGTDVYGQSIPARKPEDIKFLCGKGAKKSEDGLKMYAQLDGRPEISGDGKLGVGANFQISGDVGLETGHVDFNGHIEIEGIIEKGFHVRGKSLTVQAIESAEIEIDEDIVVRKGIIGANIKCGGKLSAAHIRSSTIAASRDVIVEKEILDSKINTDGECIVEHGRISSSRIAAKKGINSVEIGSDMSQPCTLIVGVDNLSNENAEKINNQIAETKKVKIKVESLVDELRQEAGKVAKEIEEITAEEEKVLAQYVALENKIEELQKNPNSKLAVKAEETIEQLNLKINQIKQTVVELFAKQEQLEGKIADHQKEIKNLEKEIEELHNGIKGLSEAARKDEGIAIVKVSKRIVARTIIRGPCASLTCNESYQHVRIYETNVTEENSAAKWHMKVAPL